MSFEKQFDEFCCYYSGREDHTKYLGKLSDLASQANVVTVDLETTGLDPLEHQISLIGIGVRDKKKSWNCFLFDQLEHNFTEELRPLLEAENTYKLGHNFKFDWSFLWHRMGIDCQPILDTMLAAIVCENGTMKEKNRWSLAALSLEKLGLQMDKDEELRTSFKGPPYTERQLHYAATDLVNTGELWNCYKPLIENHIEIVKLECNIIPAVASLEHAGMKVDQGKLDSLRSEASADKILMEEKLPFLDACSTEDQGKEQGKKLNPNSPKQIKAYFKQIFDIEIDDTSRITLKEITHKEARKLVEVILGCKDIQKLLGTYLKKLDPHSLPSDGRIRGRFKSLGARTGRFTSEGILQTMPRKLEIREMFVPEEGNCFVIADYSQIELRCSSELAGEKVMLRAFEKEEDLHCLTASKAFKVPLEEVSKDQRTAAKEINFGLIFGMYPKRLRQQLQSQEIFIGLSEARQFHEAFFKLYRYFKPYHTRLWVRADKEFREKGEVMLKTRSGRVRKLLEEDMRGTSKQDPSKKWPKKSVVYNTPVQSLASDGLKQALVLLWPHLKAYGARMVNLVHDEIVVESRKEDAQEMSKILEECMVKGMELYLKKVPVVVETKIASSWAEK